MWKKWYDFLFIFGVCGEVNNTIKCICDKGWIGDKCDIHTCDGYDECEEGSIILISIAHCIIYNDYKRCEPNVFRYHQPEMVKIL